VRTCPIDHIGERVLSSEGKGMAHNPLGRILCLFGRHKRSRGYVQEHQDYSESICRYCRIPMCKFDGKWRVRR